MGRWVELWGSVCKTAGNVGIGSGSRFLQHGRTLKAGILPLYSPPSCLRPHVGWQWASIIETSQEQEGLKANTREKVALVS